MASHADAIPRLEALAHPMIDRLDPDRVMGFGSRKDAERFCDHDLLIRQGLCPNGHGLMTYDGEFQQCGTCNFATNCKPELAPQ